MRVKQRMDHDLVERLERRFAAGLARKLHDLHGRELFLHAAALAFYALTAAYLGSTVFGTEGWSRAFGLGVGLIAAFIATSALAGMVLIALWLYQSHALMLAVYRTVRDR